MFLYKDKAMRQQKRKTVFSISLPIMVSMVVTQVQILTDSAFLGRVNPEFFSAVGNVFFPYAISLAFLWSVPTGTSVLIAQKVGAGKGGEGLSIAASSLKFNTLFSWGFYVFWLVMAKPVFILMGVEDPILTYSLQYIRTLSLQMVVLGTIFTADSIFQGSGYTVPLMFLGISRSVLNIFLDWVLIFGKFGLPAMGIRGAALATALCDILGLPIMLIILFRHRKIPFRLNISTVLKAKWREYKEVIRLGLPTAMEDILWNFGNLILVRFLNYLGTIETGIYTLIIRIEVTPVFFYMGIAKAAQTMVGNRIGEKKIREAIKDGLLCTRYAVYTALLFTGLFLVFPESVLKIFAEQKDFISQAAPYLFLASIWLVPKAVNITIGHGIRGYGDTKWMLFSQIFGTIFVTSLAAVFIFIFNAGMIGIFYALLIDESVRAVINAIRFLKAEKWDRLTKGRPLPKEKKEVYT